MTLVSWSTESESGLNVSLLNLLQPNYSFSQVFSGREASVLNGNPSKWSAWIFTVTTKQQQNCVKNKPAQQVAVSIVFISVQSLWTLPALNTIVHFYAPFKWTVKDGAYIGITVSIRSLPTWKKLPELIFKRGKQQFLKCVHSYTAQIICKILFLCQINNVKCFKDTNSC